VGETKRGMEFTNIQVVLIEILDNFVAKRGRQVINMKGPFLQ
jgi:hypothetical protein